ncbi:MAG: alkaline phosphatase family protein [Candidatus Cybelea sp.]
MKFLDARYARRTSAIAPIKSLLSVCVAAGMLSGCGALPFGSAQGRLAARTASGSSPIAHVVLIVQENRSFDNFFALFPGADGATRGKMKVKRHGRYVDRWVTLEPHNLVMGSDIQHCHASFLTSYDNGKMDGFNLIDFGVCRNQGKPVGTAVYQYVEQDQIKPYWDIAEQWVLADHMFQTQGSGSFTAHQDLIRGATSINPTESLIDNPTGQPWGCDAGLHAVTSLITAKGKYLRDKGPFPCTNEFPSSSYYATLRDLLDAKGVSWKYYVPCFSEANGCAPNKRCPDCAGNLLNAYDVIASVRYGSEWTTNFGMPATQIFDDITGGTLPAVSWVIPEDNEDDHPGERVDKGPSWVASVVNALGESSYWNSTAIFIVWDDWGGFYDNAVPQQFNDNLGGLGFRVPCLVVSPYAIAGQSSQGGYISHTQYEFGSLLRYIEDNFGLGNLNTTDVRANSIADVFNYAQSPRPFKHIKSPYSIRYFKTEPHTFQHGDPE